MVPIATAGSRRGGVDSGAAEVRLPRCSCRCADRQCGGGGGDQRLGRSRCDKDGGAPGSVTVALAAVLAKCHRERIWNLAVGPDSGVVWSNNRPGLTRRIAAADELTVLGTRGGKRPDRSDPCAEDPFGRSPWRLPPRRGPRSAGWPTARREWPTVGVADCPADDRPEPGVEVAEPLGPGADADAASSSPGAATAIPAPGPADNATPRANAAAPARAPVLLTAMKAPITANY